MVQNLHTTVGHTGVLIFVSVAERFAEVIADRAIHEKVPETVWQAIVADLTDHIGKGQAGEGFVPEIVSNIESILRVRGGQALRTVFIDWAGILVQRHMDANGVRDDQMRHYLTKFVNQCRRSIAERLLRP